MTLGGALRSWVERIRGGLEGRSAPWVVGVITLLLVWWLSGSLRALPWVYDESAYLLQAKIFASGRWAAPGRPLPEFFEQMHVFVTPKLVPKYPPGHALALVPGIWVGLPGLVPLLLGGLTAGLTFAVARRLTGDPWIALVAWAVWITSPVELYIRPSYMSQITTGFVWVAGWWALLRWREKPAGKWLLLFSALAAIGLITRPVTMIPYGIATGGWLITALIRRREWSRLWPMAGVALPILALTAIWSYRTSGKVAPTPYSEYSRVYAPWNMPGFGVDRSPPERAEAPAMRKFRTEFLSQHEAHVPARLPAILGERLKWIAITFFGEHGLRWALLPLALLGAMVLPRPARLGLGAAALLVLVYLWMPARPRWTVYYLEAMPVLGLVTATGAVWVARRLGALGGPPDVVAGGLVLAGMLAAVPGTVTRLVRARQAQEDLRFVPTELARAVDSIPGKAIVFLRPGPAQRPYESYVQNEPDLDQARVWLVLDRGGDNRRLIGTAPDRAAYIFDPGTGRLEPGDGTTIP